MKNKEISIPEIIRMLVRRKWIIIITILFSIIVALIYNTLKAPVYQSSVLLKKEILFNSSNSQDRVQNLLALRSQDELETDMQLVQSRSVLDGVARDLSLNIIITKIIEQDGTVTIIDLPLIEYRNHHLKGTYKTALPQINKIDIGLNSLEDNYIITFNGKDGIDVKNGDGTVKYSSKMPQKDQMQSEWEFDINWDSEISQGGEIHFRIQNYFEFFENFSSNILVEKKLKTNIFEIIVKSNYPYSTKIIANTLAENFKETRFSKNKDNIKYTLTFIDERLNEVSKNLLFAEDTLSKFKKNEKIVQIDEQSKKIIEFLSNLESERLATDLELGTYLNKLNSISKQIRRDGFIDQTYLTPEQYQSYNSPFSNTMNELSRLELAKLQLLQKRTESHPDVVMMSEQIEKIKKDLNKYNKNTLTALKIISNSLKSKLLSINSLISDYTIKLQKLPEHEAKLASLVRNRDGLEKMHNLLLDKREEMKVAELSRLQDIIVLDPAIETIKPISPNKKINLIFATLFGILLGIVMALVTSFTDKKINDIEEIERNFNFPILAVIPPYEKKISKMISTTDKIRDRFITMIDDQFRYKEAFRTLETKLASKIKGSPKTVMITSCEENAGKTTAAANLAITIAQSDKKVLLIDCDIKKPSIAEHFGLPKFSSGLVAYLTEITDTPNIYKPIKLTKNSNLIMNLDIIPTGSFSNISGEILASDRMKQLLLNLDYYDFIILDTPPITRLSDALSLGRIAKDTVLVVRAGQTEKESINWAVSELQTSNINFHGVLVNDCKIKANSFKYQYGYSDS